MASSPETPRSSRRALLKTTALTAAGLSLPPGARKLAWILMCLLLPRAVLAQGTVERPVLMVEAGGHTAGVSAMIFNPDGSRLITTSEDKTIRIWSTKTGEMLRVLRPAVGPGPVGALTAAALAPDGKTLVVAARGTKESVNPLYAVDLDTERITRLFDGHEKAVSRLRFSGNGKWLASGSRDGTVRLWNPRTGVSERLFAHRRDANTVIWDLAWSPDGKRLASAGTDGTRIWSVDAAKEELLLRDEHTDGRVYVALWVAWAPDGRTIATGCADRTIRLWSLEGKILQRYRNIGVFYGSGLAFTRNSKELLFNSTLLDLATGKTRVLAPSNGNSVLSPDESVAVVRMTDTLSLYTAAGTLLHRLGGNLRTPVSVGWSADGKAIGWGYSETWPTANEIHPLERFLDLASWEITEGSGKRYQQAQVRRGDITLVRARSPRDGVDVMKGKETLHFLESYYYNPFRCWTLVPGEEQALIGGYVGLHLFDLRTAQRTREWKDLRPLAVAPSPDGRYVLSASQDQTIRVWNLRDEQPLLSLFLAANEWIGWTPEGYFACSPGGEQLMGWCVKNTPDKLANFYPAAQFRRTLYRPDVIKHLLECGTVEKALDAAGKELGKATVRTSVEQVLPPFILITAPDKTKVDVMEATVEIRFVAKPVGKHPITAVRLMVNGRPFPGALGLKRFDVPRTGEVRDKWTVSLSPGVNTIAVQAESSVSKALSEAVEVTLSKARGVEREPEEKEKKRELPNLYVLAVGISEYPQEAMKLKYAAKDAQVLAKTFQATSHSLYRRVEVKVLTDKDATRRDILQGLTWLRKQMTQRDVAIVSFAGHGSQDADGKLYLLPADVDKEDLISTAVPGEQMKSILAGIPGRVIVLLDACHSGAVDGEKRRAAGALTDDLVRDLVTDDYGVIVMCSSMGREFSLESATVEHGFFTLALVEGLSGKADYDKAGVVYLNGLDLYVTTRVKELSKGKQHPVTTRPTSIRSFPLSQPAKQSSRGRAPRYSESACLPCERRGGTPWRYSEGRAYLASERRPSEYLQGVPPTNCRPSETE